MNAAALIRYFAAKVGLAAAYQRSTSVAALAITDIAVIFADRAAIGGITLIPNGSGATGHHGRRANLFVHQRQRHHTSGCRAAEGRRYVRAAAAVVPSGSMTAGRASA